MPVTRYRWVGRLGNFVAEDHGLRFERYVNWLRRPVAILALALTASTLCGLFLHFQGFVLALGLAAVLAVGIVWPWLSLRGLTGRLSFEKERTREGEPVRTDMSIRNRFPWGVWGLGVHAGIQRVVTGASLDRPDASLSFASGWKTTEAFWLLVPACRGEYPAFSPLITTGFPFGLWTSRRQLATDRPLLVWPRTFPVGPIPEAAVGHDADGLARRDKPGTWGDVLGVRPYRRGDTLRRIHWPQTARHGQLVVCEVRANAVPRVQVVLDTYPAVRTGSGPDGSREWAIRVAASFAEGWFKQGADVEFVIESGPVEVTRGSVRARSAAMLDALARLGSEGDRDLAALLSIAERRPRGVGLRVIVTTDAGLRA